MAKIPEMEVRVRVGPTSALAEKAIELLELRRKLQAEQGCIEDPRLTKAGVDLAELVVNGLQAQARLLKPEPPRKFSFEVDDADEKPEKPEKQSDEKPEKQP